MVLLSVDYLSNVLYIVKHSLLTFSGAGGMGGMGGDCKFRPNPRLSETTD